MTTVDVRDGLVHLRDAAFGVELRVFDAWEGHLQQDLVGTTPLLQLGESPLGQQHVRIDADFFPVVTVSAAWEQADSQTYFQDVVELGVVRSNLLLVHDTAHLDASLLQQLQLFALASSPPIISECKHLIHREEPLLVPGTKAPH